MDRFIVFDSLAYEYTLPTLKSNMDRFIVQKLSCNRRYYKTLKSNMDRFIGETFSNISIHFGFKIQYG